jgi:hypothetical protein
MDNVFIERLWRSLKHEDIAYGNHQGPRKEKLYRKRKRIVVLRSRLKRPS